MPGQRRKRPLAALVSEERQVPHSKDGISQPTIDEAALPRFLLGRTPAAQPDPWGVTAPALPAWAQDGSLFALRLLRQEVKGFRDFADSHAAELQIAPEEVQSKLVGRWKSGAPLDKAPDADDPTLARANDFDYADDPDGVKTPRFAHIRKVNPRAQVPPGADDSARRQPIRRGIPFGPPLPAEGATEAQINTDRGLIFLCAQASLENQFQFLQQKWCNDPNFPHGPEQPVGPYDPTPDIPSDGPDPIIGQHHGAGQDNFLPQNHRLLMQQFVAVRGGEYLIAPSIDGLKALAS